MPGSPHNQYSSESNEPKQVHLPGMSRTRKLEIHKCRPGRFYAFSMAKGRTTRTKTAQLSGANVLDFRGFRRVLLYQTNLGKEFFIEGN